MFPVFPMEHRLALVVFTVLLIAAAAPLAQAWARLLPEEPPPFDTPGPPSVHQISSNSEPGRKRDSLAVFLLLGTTLSFLLKFPGLPVAAPLQWLSAMLSPDDFHRLILGGRAFFIAVPALAVLYSALRPNLIRSQLVGAGVFVLLLWFLAPTLRAAIAS
jgi:hypothetical protein